MGAMKKTFALALALFLAAGGLFAASSPQVGTWKLNESKSKLTAGMGKNTMVTYKAEGDIMTVIVDGVGADGKKTHNEWRGKFDGKYYPLTGDPTADMRAYKMVDANTLDLSQRKAGKMVSSGRIVVSGDGKSRTVTTTGTNAQGKKFKNMGVYDRK